MSDKQEPEKYLFKYIKINSKNNLSFVIDESDESEFENLELKSTVATFEEEIIGKQLNKFTYKFLPRETDIIKMNYEQNKIFNKQFQSEKDQLHSSVTRILSTDYKDTFVFNYTNITDICRILSKSFNDLKKYKIETSEIFESRIKNINYEKYDFMEYLNQQKLENLKNEKKSGRQYSMQSKAQSTFCSTVSSQPIKISDDDENNEKNYENRGLYHIDIKNYYNSSKIKNIDNIILNEECFKYPKDNSDIKELPIELILLLSKLKNVKTLVFQIIDKIDEQLLKKNIFVLLNISWLFPNLYEIKLDLGNDDLQNGLNEVFELRARDLYTKYAQNKNLFYYSSQYHARTVNLWDPECDIYFDNTTENLTTNYILNDPPTEENSRFYDNHICNIYNEFDHKTNLKYIIPIRKNFDIRNSNTQLNDDFDENDNLNDSIDNKDNIGNLNKRVSIMPTPNTIHFNLPNFNNLELNQKYEELKKSGYLTTPKIVTEYVKDKIFSFEMILLFGWFLKKNKNIKKLGLFFQDSFSYEIELMLNYFDISYNNFHFLLLNNKLDNLREVDFSFNSLDNKSFENILGIINKNKKIYSLRISFFTPDINFQQSGLFKLCSEMNVSIRNIFRELKTDLSKNNNCKNSDIDYFILNNKLLSYFESNMRKLFILLRQKPALKEIVFRLDLPSLILSSEKYLLVLTKFVLNLLSFVSFEKNLIKELKILSPELILDCNKYPFINDFFNELISDEEIETFKKKVSNLEKKEEDEFTKQLMTIKHKDSKKNLEQIKKNKMQSIERNSTKKMNLGSENSILKGLTLLDKEKKNVLHSKDDNYFKSISSKNLLVINEEQGNEDEEEAIIQSFKEKEYCENYILKNITLQLKIFNLPGIFNICLVNNITGLQKINISELDEISFIGFVQSYEKNYEIMQNLISLKIGIGNSVINYTNKIENTILNFIKLNTPKLEEKFLFTHLEITNKDKFHKLIQYVYFRTEINKLVCQISGKKEMLKEIINSYMEISKTEMGALIMLMSKEEYKKLKNNKILECLTSFYSKRENRAIICKDETMMNFDDIIN